MTRTAFHFAMTPPFQPDSRRTAAPGTAPAAATIGPQDEWEVNERTIFSLLSDGTWTRADYIVGVRILLVEDEHCLADRLARGLREEGFAVQAILAYQARTGARAPPGPGPPAPAAIGQIPRTSEARADARSAYSDRTVK